MKIIINNKGNILVVLIIAMTFIALLGAGLASIGASKQEGIATLIKRQKANMLAKAGIEWAIRYASTAQDSNGNSLFYSNDNLVFSQYIDPKDEISKKKGYFETSYDPSTDLLTVRGKYYEVTETITLSHFSRYLSPVTLDPTQKPYWSSGTVLKVPVTTNNNNLRIEKIKMTLNSNILILTKITDPNGSVIFDYHDSRYKYSRSCSDNPPPCDLGWGGLYLPSSGAQLQNSPDDNIIFDQTISYARGNYTFTFLLPVAPQKSQIIFGSSGVADSDLKFFY